MDDVCVVGYGMVGKALADVFGIKKIYTRQLSESTISLKQVSECHLIFICLPTPVNDEGQYQVNDIRNLIDEIEKFGNHPVYVIRSTVFPGFADTLNNDRVISNPEFLSEATAFSDTKNPPFILIGGSNVTYMKLVAAFYQSLIKGSPIIFTDNITAEMGKLAMNAYFATKVIFANELYDSSEKLGVNYEVVKKILESHPYGPKNHFAVWYKDRRGVHGSCLPKDSKAFAYYTFSQLVAKVVELNEKYIKL